MSLSRTVPIPFHWIDPLVELLRSKFNQRQSFIVGFRDIAFYVNDESTRCVCVCVCVWGGGGGSCV